MVDWMDRICSLPRGFDAWAYREAFKGHRYILVAIDGRKRTGTCKHCGHVWETDAKVGTSTKCAKCGTKSITKSEVRNGHLRHNEFVSVVQRIPGAVVVRTVLCKLDFGKTPAKLTHSETRRVVWPDGAKAPIKYGRAWMPKPGVVWEPTPHSSDSYPNIVHPCCRAALKNTRWKYSGLPEAGKLGPVPVETYLRSYLRYPCIEMLAKMGMRQLMLAAVEAGRPCNKATDRLRGKPEVIVGLPHRYWPIVRELDMSPQETARIAAIVGMGHHPTLADARVILEVPGGAFYGDVEWARLLFHRHPELDYRVTMDYLAKQDARARMDYRDYLGRVRTLRLDATDADVICPADLKAAHDRLSKRVAEVKQAEATKRIQERVEKQRALRPMLETAKRGMLTRIAETANDIVREGEALHHCVGTYAERVAKGECLIVFVRQEAAPDVPFVTVEIQGDRVVQARGRNNASPPKEVERFIREWTATWQQGRTVAAGR